MIFSFVILVLSGLFIICLVRRFTTGSVRGRDVVAFVFFLVSFCLSGIRIWCVVSITPLGEVLFTFLIGLPLITGLLVVWAVDEPR